MRKSFVIVIATLTGVVLIGYWLLAHVFVVYAPRGGLYHIDTPGGPVPMSIVIFDKRWVIVQIGYDERMAFRVKPENLVSYDVNKTVDESLLDPPRPELGFEFQLKKFRPKANSYVLNFPENSAKLIMEPSSFVDWKHSQQGRLVVRDGSHTETVFLVNKVHSHNHNWFEVEQTESAEDPVIGFEGRWVLKNNDQQEIAMIDLTIFSDFEGVAEPFADAILSSDQIEHRGFTGRLTGNLVRIASFDNAYPALIHTTLQSDDILQGDIWVGNRLHESFVGVRVDD